MARGGYRPGSGPKKGTKYKPRTPKPEVKPKRERAPKVKAPKPPPEHAPVLSEEDAKQAAAQNLTPLEYLLAVMNDANKDENTRIRAASLAAPFVHPRAGEAKGKKEEKGERAKTAGQGKFAPAPAPLKVVK